MPRINSAVKECKDVNQVHRRVTSMTEQHSRACSTSNFGLLGATIMRSRIELSSGWMVKDAYERCRVSDAFLTPTGSARPRSSHIITDVALGECGVPFRKARETQLKLAEARRRLVGRISRCVVRLPVTDR